MDCCFWRGLGRHSSYGSGSRFQVGGGMVGRGSTDAAAPDLTVLWDMDSADYECDCPGPPPEFRLPPPPRPPFLQDLDCSESPLPELETCDAVPVIDAEFHSSPAIPSLAVIVVCSVLLVAMVLIASALVWKHKRKMQNFLPCKTSPQNRCEVSNGNGVIYEDLTNIRPRTIPAPPIEMIDVKSAGFPASVFICQPPRTEPYTSQELYNPVYEELSNGSGERGDSDPESEGGAPAPGSEDEFAEDELSLAGECDTGMEQGVVKTENTPRELHSSDGDERTRFQMSNPNGHNFSLPSGYRPNNTNRGSRAPKSHRTCGTEQRRPRSLERRRGWRAKGPPLPQDCGEFHEGLLLDALFQLYPAHPPAVPSVGHRLPYLLPQVPSSRETRTHLVNPYESVPVLNHLQQQHYHRPEMFSTFRPLPVPSQDSSFGSDSGYSNNTSGGGAGRVASRGRKEGHRLSAHSGDLVIS
ncbi:uncharacterized protein pxb [Anabrus simplex]|uniref:uncharacterized protein pxb n=1 Tax=Anabrus simplex TaxID=316456 RepID=UPI0035A3411F